MKNRRRLFQGMEGDSDDGTKRNTIALRKSNTSKTFKDTEKRMRNTMVVHTRPSQQ